MIKNKTIAVYGASGFGREVMPVVRSLYGSEANLIFVDDSSQDESLNNYTIHRYEEFLAIPAQEKFAVIAIADATIRERLTIKLHKDDIKILSIEAPNTIILDDNSIGEGAILCPFVTITSNAKVGIGFHANIYSYVAHDCIIGNFVTFAPSVKCNGNVHIEDYAYIGTGAIIKQGTPDKPLVIGKGAIVGMGAIVTKSVKAGDVVFGNPAKSIKRGK
jgi:sugar O-acyltransferase (sialic acid O-acetyltransferase NeuD family)